MNTEVEPSVRVLSAYKGQRAYMSAAAVAAESELSKLWEEYVLDPYRSYWAPNRELIGLVGLAGPAEDLKNLAKFVEDLSKSGIEQLIHEVVRIIFQALPGPDTTICVYAANPDDPLNKKRVGGIGGAAPGAGKIMLMARPEGDWKAQVGYTLAHEHHHSVWNERHRNSSRPFDLNEYLVFEGRAIAFAHMMYPPDPAPPWLEILTPEEEVELWPRMKADLDSDDPGKMRKYMLGGEGIPYAAGYTIGFHIVQSYLRAHPAASVDDWTALDSRTLLEESGYDGTFNV